ncbi:MULTISPECIES: hypothetical protein [unclassified Duganella]|uniref:hypothetical protein n=1 Tax=unclassified Duganella TaxID=2636909 RepID=UPI0006F86F8E|nr:MULTISPECIES: hypothetical protein [unclassified Duganella]KQV46703.1 hypothetical protein ASD07_14720 [Duganella sp. Root336D2]KRC00935.1 hypothetical protein ASE26_21710 [Duganella sp. Root198D2]
MNTMSKAGALLLGAALATGVAGCKNRTEDTSPAPVTAAETVPPAASPATPAPAPAPVTPTTPPSDTTTPPPDTTVPPATGATPGTSGTSGTQGNTGAGQPPAYVPDKTDQKDMQRDRRPTY